MAKTFKGFRLNAFQQRAVDSIESGHNVLVSAPTGAGKTLVAEYAIELAMQRDRRCIYTAPVKALSNQKYRDFRDDPEIDVGIMTGDVTIHPNARLLIMTTEILRNSIFEDPERLHDVDYVIFDEVHYMDDLERGSVWEESIIFAPSEIGFIGLSATIANIHEFGQWIEKVRDRRIDVIEHERRPVPLKHMLFHETVGAFVQRDLPKVRKTVAKTIQRRHRTSARDSRTLIDFVVKERLLPTLYFCFSRRECEKKARVNLWRSLLDPEERARMEELFQHICTLYQLSMDEDLEDIRQQALRGIGYHHAGMLPIHKEIVERLFTSGLLKLLFTTETFALGINMPARTVVFNSLRKFDGISFDYLKSRDYMQMAGRAGRQGIDAEGTVFSLVDANDLVEAPFQRILQGRAEPIVSRFNLSYSTLIALRERLGDRIFEAWEKSFNAFQFETRKPKHRERNRAQQARLIENRLTLLEELGYLEGSRVLDRGKVATLIQGYEIQITELLFGGYFDSLSAPEICVLFAAIVFEERRGDVFSAPRKPILGTTQFRIERMIRTLAEREASYGLPPAIKLPVFSLSPAIWAWANGAAFAELEDFTNVPPGDLVRTCRLAVQLIRQLRQIVAADTQLAERLTEAIARINRDEVDARRQLELG